MKQLAFIAILFLSACVQANQPIPSEQPSTPLSKTPIPPGTATATLVSPRPETETPTLPEPNEFTVWGWKVLLLGDENVVAEDLTLRLHEDGTLSGFTGCRAFNGVYRVEGEGFLVFHLETDGEACADPAKEDLESRYLEALGQVERFWLGEDLVLRTGPGLELDFMREPVQAEPPPGWNTYTQETYGFQVHYPAGWRVEALPEDPTTCGWSRDRWP
jgi:heat shock protein HslJ